MSIKTCVDIEKYNQIDNEIFDKDASIPEEMMKKSYKYRSQYLYDLITDKSLLELLRINFSSIESEFFYISGWNIDEHVYEFTFDDNIEKEYEKFLYWPKELSLLVQPKSEFGLLHENIFIVNKSQSIAITSDRYYDIMYFYSNEPINNLEENLQKYEKLF